MTEPDPHPDPYGLLGVQSDASPDEIRAAFRSAVRREHPDTTAGTPEDTRVREVIAAYHLLIDPASRARYDARQSNAAGRRITVRSGRSGPAHQTAQRPTACRRCQGAGVVRTASTCHGCGGRAEITVLDGPRSGIARCRRCGGAGTVNRLETCGLCRGTGLEPSADVRHTSS